MNVIQAIIYGLVEGFTEFLPVSSTAHLIILSNFFHLPQDQFISFFEVFIQAGAILAVLLLYAKYVWEHRSLVVPIIVSFIPTGIIGFAAHGVIKNIFFKSPLVIASSLIVVGVIFIIVEMMIARKKLILNKGIDKISYAHAFIVGVCQACAIVPGVSRAGAVIISMMLLKYKRTDAAIYSFLLAVPTILAASVLDFLKTDFSVLIVSSNAIMLGIGFATSFFAALIFVKWFIQYLQKNTLTAFAIYRIIAGATLLLLFQRF